MTAVPTHWYNVLADLPFELPPDLPPPGRPDLERSTTMALQLPMGLVRQAMSRAPLVPIPEPVRERYLSWRPTPLKRARALERAIGTRSRIYYKEEGGNASGSHKLCTALAQAHAYAAAGAKRLVTGTGAGQWGTALAIACREFGLECTVYMVHRSYHEKPYRRTMMAMHGADVVPSSPGADHTGIHPGNIAHAVTEAYQDALAHEGTQLAVGSGEAYSILHSTVIGLEARHQLRAGHDDRPDVVVSSLGAGSNFGGIAMPFVGEQLRGESDVRCVSVESTGCPKLTRGRYAYDVTDGSGATPLQKMYTLGSRFTTGGGHLGGLRYHACSTIISALRHHDLIDAVAYPQSDVFASAVLFARLEGTVPAPESAHAVHGAIEAARRADTAGVEQAVLFCLSGHGLFDLSAYDDFLSGRMTETPVSDEEIRRSLAHLPQVTGQLVDQ